MKRNRSLIVIITLLIQTLFIIIINSAIFVSPNITKLKESLPFINLFIIIMAALTILSIKKVQEEAENNIKIKLLNKQLQEVENLNYMLQTQQHEHSRHIQSIQAMVYLETYEELKEYINGIAKNYRYTDNLINVGHPAITSLVNTKRNIAQSLGIDFAIAAKCNLYSLNIPAWDLCSILGNLIDNAIEAAVYDTNPKVAIDFTFENEIYNIIIKNNGLVIPEDADIFSPGFSTKDPMSRGYGLFVVKNLLKHYGGEIQFNRVKHTTIVHLKLPPKQVRQSRAAL